MYVILSQSPLYIFQMYTCIRTPTFILHEDRIIKEYKLLDVIDTYDTNVEGYFL